MIVKFNSKELKQAKKEILKGVTKNEIRAYMVDSIKKEILKHIDKYVEKVVKEELLTRIKLIVKNELRNKVVKVESVSVKTLMAKIDISRIEKKAKNEIMKEMKKKLLKE